MRFIPFVMLLLFQAAFIPTLQAATITANVDRDTLHLNESFQLVLEATGSIDDDPDFSVLEQDFDILSRSQSSNISIINGNYSKTIKWSLVLMPKKEGRVTIPSVPFGKDQSPQLRMTVKPAGAPGTGQGGDLYLEVDASPKNAYVQGQVLVTVKMFSGQNIARYGINELQHQGVDVVLEQLGDDKQYRAYRGNKPYLVLERNYALFPQQAGDLRIQPFRGEVEISSGPRSMFDPFGGRNKVKRVASRGLDIRVNGVPAAFSGSQWLPARELQLVEEWPDARNGQPVFKVGEPVTRTLSILADGLSSAQLPELTQADIDGIKQYPDQPSLHDNKKADGIIGIREERIALIPTRPGRYTLPAIDIPWWDTVNEKRQTAHIPARQIQVIAGSAAAGSQAAQPPAADTATTRAPAASADTSTPPAGQDTPPTTTESPADGPWKLLSLLLGVGWLATLLAWWWSRRMTHSASDAEPSKPSEAAALKQLQQACGSNQAGQCQQALIHWARAHYQASDISSLGEVGRRAGEPLQTAIAELETALYSPHPGDWTGQRIIETCRQMGQARRTDPGTSDNGLEPLYK